MQRIRNRCQICDQSTFCHVTQFLRFYNATQSTSVVMTTSFLVCVLCIRLRRVQPRCIRRKNPTHHVRKLKNVEISKTHTGCEWNSVFRCPIFIIQTCSTTISSMLITNLMLVLTTEQLVLCMRRLASYLEAPTCYDVEIFMIRPSYTQQLKFLLKSCRCTYLWRQKQRSIAKSIALWQDYLLNQASAGHRTKLETHHERSIYPTSVETK